MIAIPRDVFLRGVQSDPALMRNVLETTARRLQVSGERESALAFLSSDARIVRVLLLLDQRGRRGESSSTTQENLAQYVGLTRQTVAKALGEWRRAGWVGTGAVPSKSMTGLRWRNSRLMSRSNRLKNSPVSSS